MKSPAPIQEIIYVSFLSGPVGSVTDIAKKARVSNRVMQITGVLVFDGERFCQYLEGPPPEVLGLYERISADSRHENIQLVHQGHASMRSFRSFSMGYCYLTEDDLIGRVSSQAGVAARAALLEMKGQIDFGA